MLSGRATIQDVADEAGVSVATVSRALRNKPNVAPATRSKVADVAGRLGYHAHTAASWLASGRTMTVGFVAPYFEIWYTGQVLAGIERTLSEAGYDLAVYAVDTPENREGFLERVASLQTRLDGLLLVDFYPDAYQVSQLVDCGTAVVAIGEHLSPFNSLMIDNELTAVAAVTHLIDLGHEHIAVLGSRQIQSDGSPVLKARQHGYRRALSAAGLGGDARLELPGMLTVHGGALGIDRLVEMDNRPTAVVCLSDETAMGAMSRARQLGVSIPNDLSVIGIDDHDLADAFGLTTMGQPVRDIGAQAAAMLLAAIDDTNAEVEHRVIDTNLIVRESTSPPSP